MIKRDGLHSCSVVSFYFMSDLLDDADALEQAEAELATYKTAFFDAERAFGQAEAERDEAINEASLLTQRLLSVHGFEECPQCGGHRRPDGACGIPCGPTDLGSADDLIRSIESQRDEMAGLAERHRSRAAHVEAQLVAHEDFAKAVEAGVDFIWGDRPVISQGEAMVTDALPALRTKLDKLNKQARGVNHE
jgi:hypothetical protein